jgi:metal-responsive CopG/Arc/MetJ family transcriptional regulator
MKGTTISITIPETLLDHYNDQAKKLKTSRSKIINNILLNDFNKNCVSSTESSFVDYSTTEK